ncbi:MAG: lactate utilization protein [Candidatus Micrarchaeota archaeon]|nr:lactate utilization protein [Candidatus Micrarchaeota archaeon]
MEWVELAGEEQLERTIKALNGNGIDATAVENGEEARNRLIGLIPKGSEVFHATSITLREIGATKAISESGDYEDIGKKARGINDASERAEARRRSLSPEYVVGSVHAVTEKGEVVIASASGSQLAPYVFGAKNVIWVVGTQKIVKNLDDAFKRIYERSLPMENDRVRKAYGMQGSTVAKILIFNRERPGRIKLIFVKELLGF